MKLYTGGGDRGKTSLFSGERIRKSHDRIEAYGDLDELSSILGTMVSAIASSGKDLIPDVHQIQSDLFTIGAWLATTKGASSADMLDKITQSIIRQLEERIDELCESLPPLNGFVLPGGHLSAGLAHMARTVCRRVERHVIRFVNSEPESSHDENLELIIIYLNRLSDYLFVLARRLNHLEGIKDNLWKK